jgi:hypothetical protein
MAAGPYISTHLVLQTYQTLSGNTDRTQVIPETASQTFLEGAPVMLYNGYISIWNGTVGTPSVTQGIAGVAKQPGANLATSGLGAPAQPWGSVSQPGTSVTFGSVPYQTGAYNIPEGAPFSDGRTIFTEANQDTVFIGQVDSSSSGTVTATTVTFTQAILGQIYGLTADSNGYWYVDLNKTTGGTNTCVVVVGFDPISGIGVANGNVLFKFLPGICQFNSGIVV